MSGDIAPLILKLSIRRRRSVSLPDRFSPREIELYYYYYYYYYNNNNNIVIP
jgi:hypothetical protein